MQTKFIPVIILLLSLFCQITFANAKLYKVDTTIRGSTTLFVLDGKQAYNDALQAIVEKVWVVTPYKFITQKQMKDYLGNNDFSMAFRINYFGGTTPGRYDYFQIFRGLRRLDVITSGTDVASEALLNRTEEEVMMTLPNIIERLQNRFYFDLCPYCGRREKLQKEAAHSIIDKKLYVLKSQTNYSEEFKEKAAKAYPYPIEFVDEKAIQNAIYDRNDKVCYIYKMGYGGTTIIDAASDMILFESKIETAEPKKVDIYFLKDLAKHISKE